MMILAGIAAGLATFLGGLVALRLSDRLHLILGFSAGAVLGVAFFDLFPEAVELASVTYDTHTVFAFVALGFVLYLLADRLIFLHGHTHESTEDHKAHAPVRGSFGAGTLAFHSMLDGLAVGLSFQVSSAVGMVVALAVLAHDFSDGINTVSFITKNGGERKTALKWLMLDAFAPLVGICISLFIQVEMATLGILLALFSGFFLYIGASDLLPESHHQHPKAWTTVSSVFGMLALYLIISLAGH